ncbi:MAG: hypothetical protein R3B99_21835 [Polyangiales bacterium]|nr:hypothetical protein [Myxococcales bacterium]MCB9604726.1 hypothetical protein [Sandaracinus sp.]
MSARMLRACFVAWTAWLVSVTVVHADARVFERGRDAQTGEVPNEREHRYVDLTAFLQPGLLFRLTDEDVRLARGDDQVVLQRARIGLNARLIWWLRLRMEMEFAGSTPSLADGFLEFMPHDAFHVSIGQMQVPFLHAYQFNELNLGFIDRPIYTPLGAERPFLRYLSPRDIGVMVSGRVGDLTEGATMPVFEYWLAAMVGERENITINNNDNWLYAGRVKLHIRGVPQGAAAESDLARNTVPRIAVAGGVYSNCDDRENWNRGFTADAELRWNGLYASGSFVWFKNGPAQHNQFGYGERCPGQTGADGNPLRFVSAGAHAQVGYVLPEMLFPVRNQAIELLARFDWVNPIAPFDSSSRILGGDETHPQYVAPSLLNDGDNAPTRYRVTLGVSWYPTGQQTLRLQLNYQINRELEDIVTSEGSIVGVRNEVLWLQITAGL